MRSTASGCVLFSERASSSIKPAEIADALRAGFEGGHRFEKQLYYSVANQCLSTLREADVRGRVALFCAGQLALALAAELEGDAIHASAALLWENYGAALERTIRLAGSDISAQEVLWQLSAAIADIYPPEGGA